MTSSAEQVHQFLETLLRQNASGELKEEFTCGIPTTADHLPHALLRRGECEAKLDFIIQEELVFWVYQRPPHRLLLRRWNMFERLLHFLHLSPAVPTNDPEIDRIWLMQNISAADAARLIDPRIRSLLKKLGPFEELEWTDQAFRCLKVVDISKGYTPENALQDLDVLIHLAEALR